jgi:hypothetical protein
MAWLLGREVEPTSKVGTTFAGVGVDAGVAVGAGVAIATGMAVGVLIGGCVGAALTWGVGGVGMAAWPPQPARPRARVRRTARTVII